MMNHRGYGDNSSQASVSKRRLDMTTYLFKSVPDMGHIDQLFLWLSYAIVQHFSAQVVQFWVAQDDHQGKLFMQARASVSQDNSLPYLVTLNESVAALAKEVLSRRTDLALDHVSNLFSSYLADLFGRYGLYYCFGVYLNSSRLLSSPSYDLSVESRLLPMEATTLLFFSHPPWPELQKSIHYILKIALQLAETHGLLLSAADTADTRPENKLSPLQQRSLVALSELIPHRREEADLMRSSNLLAGSIVISDKLARRLYAAIDGHKNLQELRAITHLDWKETSLALQLLLTQGHIQLYDPAGQFVDDLLFFNDR